MNHFLNSSLTINRVPTLITSRGIHLHHQKVYKTRTVWPLLPFYVEFIWKKKKNTVAIRSWYKPFSLINCRATSCWNFSKLSKSSFMWKSMRKGRPSSVSSCTESKRQDSFLPFPKYAYVIPAAFKVSEISALETPEKKTWLRTLTADLSSQTLVLPR